VIQHDPWIVKGFLEQTGNVPVIAALAIDGKNCRCDYLNGLDMAIFWTDFAEREARAGGYAGPARVVPLGVDLDIYKPFGDKKTALAQIGIVPTDALVNGFIVGYLCRNQPRKRLDLAVRHFSEWVKSRQVTDAYLYIQSGPTGEASYDVAGLMEYERLSNRLIHVEQGFRRVYPEERLAFVYRALDLFWSTTQGEGFGLPALEAMACGTPCALPNWSGYGCWASAAAHLVRCGDVSGTLNWPGTPRSGVKIAVLGGVPALDDDVAALDRIYRDHAYRAELREKALRLAADDRYRWPTIGRAYSDAIRDVLDGPIRMSAMG
jgi:glycosyltransferase involved in cell wall biosynthesis